MKLEKRTCQACVPPKKFMGTAQDNLCPACTVQFEKMYPELKETGSMGKKANSKKANGQTAKATPAAAKKATAPAAVEEELVDALDMDDEGEDAEPVDVTDEVPTGDVDDEPEEEAAPASGKTSAAWAFRHPKRAAKRLKNAVARLEKFEWEEMGVPGVKGALAVMKNAIPQLEKRATARTKVTEGGKVQVREKYRGRYEDFFSADDMMGLTVKKIANKTAKCTTSKNVEVMFPVAALEPQPEADKGEALVEVQPS